MTVEALTSQQLEAQKVENREFLIRLYERIIVWAKEHGMEEVATFEPQEVPAFQIMAKGWMGSVDVSFALEHGIVLKKPGLVFGVVLGSGHYLAYNQKERPFRLAFGGSTVERGNENTIEGLKRLVSVEPRFADYLYGQFAEGVRGIVDVDCWVDDPAWGGKGISSGFSAWPKEKLYSEDGLNACLQVVQETVRRG